MKFRFTSESFLEAGETLNYLSKSVMERLKHRPTTKYIDKNKYGGWLVALFIFTTILAIVTLAYLIYACIRKKRSYKDYNTRPETYIKHPRLNSIEEGNMNEYYFEPLKTERRAEEIEIARKELMHGVVDEVTFPSSREWMSLMFNRRLEGTSYFEVEIQSVKASISLGFAHVKDYEQMLRNHGEVGHIGVGISQNGLIKQNGIFIYNFQFACHHGDTIGVGITSPQQRVWFTHNGRFLNPPTSIQLQQWEREAIEQQQTISKATLFQRIFGGNNEQKPSTKQPVEVIGQQDIQRIQQRVKLNHPSFEFYAIVSCKNEPAGYLNINFGGALFRYAVPEFQKGLLREEYEEKYCGWVRELCS